MLFAYDIASYADPECSDCLFTLILYALKTYPRKSNNTVLMFVYNDACTHSNNNNI